MSHCPINRLTAFLLCFTACGSTVQRNDKVGPDAHDSAGDANSSATQNLCISSNGTRLQREYIVLGDEKRQEFKTIDSQHDVYCTYLPEPNGSFTCYPTEWGGQLFFNDANCSQGLVGMEKNRAPFAFQRTDIFPDECGRIRQYRKVESRANVDSGQTLYTQIGNDCLAISAPNLDYYQAGQALASSSFVTASGSRYSESLRLSELVLNGSDGSSMCSASGVMSDAKIKSLCSAALAGDGALRCLPFGSQLGSIYPDGLCSTTVNVVIANNTCSTTLPSIASKPTPLSCGKVSTQIYQIDGAAEPNRYDLIGGSCIDMTEEDESYLRVGSEILPSDIEPLKAWMEPSEQRLQRQLLRAPDGFTQFPGTWQDSLLNTPCQFKIAADDSYRCLPLAIPLVGGLYYADASCSMPLLVTQKEECSKEIDYLSALVGGKNHVYHADLYGPKVYTEGSASCIQIFGQFLKPGLEISPTNLAEATIRTR